MQTKTNLLRQPNTFFFLAWVLMFQLLPVRQPQDAGMLLNRHDELGPSWSEPVNLSRSGAASAPRVVVGEEGEMQAFWWDSFDGMMTSVLDANSEEQIFSASWSEPQRSPIESLKLDRTPELIGDGNGWVHAFWLEVSPETGGTQLYHSRVRFGGTDWSPPEILARSAVAFDFSISPEGDVYVAYVRTAHTSELPAGVYLRVFGGNSRDWQPGVAIYPSIYFRVLPPEQAWVRVWGGANGEVHITWQDPRLGQSLYRFSQDHGASWSPLDEMGEVDDWPVEPRVVNLQGRSLLRIWQAKAEGACSLYQQERISYIDDAQSVASWTKPAPILPGLLSCPVNDQFWIQDDQVVWVYGEGSTSLSVAAWDAERVEWTQPKELSFRFEDRDVKSQVGLSDLHAAIFDGKMTIVGVDETAGEVWSTTAQSALLDLVFAPPSPWSTPQTLTRERAAVGLPTVAIDEEGRAHFIWTETTTVGEKKTTLLYSRWDERELSPPVTVVPAGEGEIVRDPAVVADAKNQLHMVWSGGVAGDIFYRRSAAGEANSPSAWTSPVKLSASGLALFPQIGMDSADRIYVIYAVPFNENRGLYLARSEDGGKSWANPEIIYNARDANLQMVGHPALAVEPNGLLHVAWVEPSPPDTWDPQGIFYMQSEDGGRSWTEPFAIMGAGYDWPRLALAGNQVHVLFAGAAGGIWHRWAPLGQPPDSADIWSISVRVPGWQSIHAPFGVAVDGIPPAGTLHLLGRNPNLREPAYSTWDGERWSNLEQFAISFQADPASGMAAATRPEGGILASAWVEPSEAGANTSSTLSFIYRTISVVDLSVAVIPTSATSPTTSTPQPTEVVVEPTPTPSPVPDLNNKPVSNSQTNLPPLALGGSLAALIVFVVIGAYLVRANPKN